MKTFRYIYTAYAWIVGGSIFVIIALTGIIGMSVTSPQKYNPVFKAMLKFMFHAIFIRVKVILPENFDKSKAYVYMPNHVSLLDSPLMAAYLPQYISALEAKEHFNWPLYGWLAKKYQNIPINRKSVPESLKSVSVAKKKLKSGISIIVFPEGSRTMTGKMERFKKLPFHLAQDAGVSIIPVGVSGIFDINHKGTILLWPGKILMKFGQPLDVEYIKNTDVPELMNGVKNQIQSLIEYR
ncbi:MAG: 1-acyl-sn-glycerol-3-phosphate acyltransferase [Bacteroidales bacterium]|nr:1-acyl-sn-glycerol-3-phosphate acyltransferase [Bacteroidales bacterium]